MSDPVKLDFSKAQPINPPSSGGINLDFSGAQPLSAGPDDPNGNYDFGDLGKVQGARTNGRPSTRQEAFQSQLALHGFGQSVADTLQSRRQDVSNFISSNVDADQATKGYMGDLAGMLVGQGLGSAGKILQAARWSEGADALSGLVRSYTPGPAKKFVGKLLGAPDALEQQTSPTMFRQFGEEYHMPVSGPPPGPRAGAPPILTPLDAALQREGGTAASSSYQYPLAQQQLPFLNPSQQPPPAQVQAQPPAQQLPFLKPNTAPVPESPPVASPVDPKQFYGKTSGKSSLKANQRQLASPTGSTAPNPTVPAPAPHPPNIMKILQTPGNISDADMNTLQNYFAQKRLMDLLNGGTAKAAD